MKLKVIAVNVVLAAFGASSPWDECKQTVLDIQAGTRSIGDINNRTIDTYLYHGSVVGLRATFPRENYLAVTYPGCVAICGNPVAWYEPQKAIGVASNWIFPLAILLNLPWESHRRKKISKSLFTVLSWLGSPQTALTATIFNFRQLRDAHRRAPGGEMGFRHNNAYFVLCCLNQFGNLPLVVSPGPAPPAQAGIELGATRPGAAQVGDAIPEPMLEALIYGVFRPLSADHEPDVNLTHQLLVMLSHQLRMYRRRGVIPTLANLGVFLIAFIFSIILAFAQLGDENTPFSLAFGLLVSWLPLLVIFSIVDRNPVSSERTAMLISRWLHNVDAVMTWAARPQATRGHIAWWRPGQPVHEHFQVHSFIGQGREPGYCGLPHAILQVTESINLRAASRPDRPRCTVVVTNGVAAKLAGGKSLAWYGVAATSFLLVWTAILCAFVVSYTAPTLGLGCRTLTYIVFGVFSSVSWFIQFSKHPRRWAIWTSRFFNALAVVALMIAVIFQVSGLASNCWCKSSALSLGMSGAYVDFEGFLFYRKNFDVDPYWIGAAAVGGSVPTIAFIVALFWWIKCKPLWRADGDDEGHWEEPEPRQDQDMHAWADMWADTRWLQ